MIGTTFPFIQNHHSLEKPIKSPMKLRMPDFCAKTACVTFVTYSACKTTRNKNHTLAVLDLVIMHIMVDKIPRERISGKSPDWSKIRRASNTFQCRGHIPNGLPNIVGYYLEVGKQTVTLNCFFTSQIQTCQTLIKLKTCASMWLLTQASVITHANRKKQQFRT